MTVRPIPNMVNHDILRKRGDDARKQERAALEGSAIKSARGETFIAQRILEAFKSLGYLPRTPAVHFATAIMAAMPLGKAGVGSAVNDPPTKSAVERHAHPSGRLDDAPLLRPHG